MHHLSRDAGAGQSVGRAGFGALFLIASVSWTALLLQPERLEAQQAVIAYDIPAGPLDRALTRFGSISGLQLLYQSNVTTGRTTGGVKGSLDARAALARIMADTGVAYRFTAPNRVEIGSGQPDASDTSVAGATVLRPIVISGKSDRLSGKEDPYYTDAPTSYIGQDDIEHFRGSSPADIFKGTPGVSSGEARNGAGSVDVNIRGMQGMGRVAVTVDGAENSLQIYQGYQGISNRTYVDPDLLAGVDITKGSDASSGGIAGSVAMRTLSVEDVIEDGERFGVRLKGGFGTNTTSPEDGALGGYSIRNRAGGTALVTASPDGLDRSPFLQPTDGSGSVVAAMRDETFDFLAGYAYRKRGNYYAGSHGDSANPESIGPQPFCYSSGLCIPSLDYKDYVINTGSSSYRAGEEVLNSQLETKSFLAKGTIRFGEGQSLQAGYTGFRSEAGDRLASRFAGTTAQAQQQALTSGAKVDTGTLKYRLNPEDNDLIDLQASLYLTRLEQRNPIRTAFGTPPSDRSGSDTTMWGAAVDNISTFLTNAGSLDATYGLSYKSEDTVPGPMTKELETWLDYRDGQREEAAAYAKADWKPSDWLSLNGGLRYTHFWSKDRNKPLWERGYNYTNERNEGGFSPSVGATLEPWDGTQFYVKYSNALRMPSLFESVSAFTMEVNPNLKPERSSNWELGTNFVQEGIFAHDDTAMLKLGFFDWNVKNYISREWYTAPDNVSTMRIHNIDSAHFQGLELSSRYERGGFAANLTANYYLDVEFCRTASTCSNKSLYADYATNQVPPEYSLGLTLTQQLFEERLTLGARVSHVGPRAIGHGDVTAQGASQFISLVNWKHYTLVDVFADYKINDNFTATFRIENLTDRYYVDPLSLVTMPGPGRTFYASLTAKF